MQHEDTVWVPPLGEDTTVPNPNTPSLTISDDHSKESPLQQRKLLAIQDPDYQPSKPLYYQCPYNCNTSLTSEYALRRHLSTMHMHMSSSLSETEGPIPRYQQRDIGDEMFHRPPSGVQTRSIQKSNYRSSSTDITEEYPASSMESHIAYLEARIKKLQAGQIRPVPSRYQVLCRLRKSSSKDTKDDRTDQDIENQAYLDLPEQVQSQHGDVYLRCSVPVTNFELYIATNPDISFIVFRDYPRQITPDRDSLSDCLVGPEGTTSIPEPPTETIYPVSPELKKALRVVLDGNPNYDEFQRTYHRTKELPAPYLFVYHSRHNLSRIQESLSTAEWSQLELLIDYIDSKFGSQYDTVDSLLEKGEILEELVQYLFTPGEVLVAEESEGYRGYVSRSWVQAERHHNDCQGEDSNKIFDAGNHVEQLPQTSIIPWNIRAETWGFDGEFYKETKELTLNIPPTRFSDVQNRLEAKGTEIASLSVFPLRFAPTELVEKLHKRGNTLWKCRTQRLVSYRASEQESLDYKTDDRYMIDMKSYKYLHHFGTRTQRRDESVLNPTAMSNEDPPDDQFLFLMPPTVKGYNLRRKKWFDISIDRISDVVWNKQAFNSLVVDRKSKDFIQALVSNHLESEKSTDLIEGKGNGLILLLHGGPGTGKTLTAESVAEIAEKPLYRVTCGDVGIEPEKVERYLDSVLHLGKIWGCVVLLDEADVFLEQRSLEDLARNALVSVFLRVLEYYDGILILTSNRVGTFDEAFRSRIQLALHYPSLGPHQRYRIWQTFIARLRTVEGESIDIDDLEDHLEELKDEKLNGRQIRNVITTARQYARWKKTTLTYEHLKDAMEVSGRFNTYLDKLNEGHSADEIAQDEGLRLA